MHLWLIGMMGAGKTRVGRRVAELAGVAFRDTDEEVAAEAGCSIEEVWEIRGEAGFRELEAAAVARLASEPQAVIATGGGAVLVARNVAVMRATGLVVWLEASPEVLAARVGAETGRPLLTGTDPRTRLAELLAARRARYDEAAHRRIPTDGRKPEAVAQEVWRAWSES